MIDLPAIDALLRAFAALQADARIFAAGIHAALAHKDEVSQ